MVDPRDVLLGESLRTAAICIAISAVLGIHAYSMPVYPEIVPQAVVEVMFWSLWATVLSLAFYHSYSNQGVVIAVLVIYLPVLAMYLSLWVNELVQPRPTFVWNIGTSGFFALVLGIPVFVLARAIHHMPRSWFGGRW